MFIIWLEFKSLWCKDFFNLPSESRYFFKKCFILSLCSDIFLSINTTRLSVQFSAFFGISLFIQAKRFIMFQNKTNMYQSQIMVKICWLNKLIGRTHCTVYMCDLLGLPFKKKYLKKKVKLYISRLIFTHL